MNEIHNIKDITLDVISNIENRYNCQKQGFPTGYSNLDRMIGGFGGSELTVIVANHAQIGSIFTMNMVAHLCVESRASVGVFTNQSPADKYVFELLCSYADIAFKPLSKGYLNSSLTSKIYQASKALAESNLYLNDDRRLPFLDFRNACRRMKDGGDVDLIVIDNISGVEAPFEKLTSTHEVLASIKSLAEELDIRVIAIAETDSLSADPGLPRLSRDIQLIEEFGQEADALWLLAPSTLPRTTLTREDDCEEVDLSVIVGQADCTGDLRFKFNRQNLRFRECQ